MPLGPAFLLLGRCPGETRMGVNKETCSDCSMHHRSVNAKNKKQKSIKHRVKKKLEHVYKMEYYMAIKMELYHHI